MCGGSGGGNGGGGGGMSFKDITAMGGSERSQYLTSLRKSPDREAIRKEASRQLIEAQKEIDKAYQSFNTKAEEKARRKFTNLQFLTAQI